MVCRSLNNQDQRTGISILHSLGDPYNIDTFQWRARIIFFLEIRQQLEAPIMSKIILKNQNTSTQLTQQLTLYQCVIPYSLHGSYLAFKWLK